MSFSRLKRIQERTIHVTNTREKILARSWARRATYNIPPSSECYSLAHSTRLFPKGRGAHAYALTGIAARCDWVLLTDNRYPFYYLVNNTGTKKPQTVYVSTKHIHALRYFSRKVLPCLQEPIALVTGGSDKTIPLQIDKRYPAKTKKDVDLARKIADSPYIAHWYIENLDSNFSDKVSPLPLGFHINYDDNEFIEQKKICLPSGRLKVLLAHRIRDGQQWDTRKSVTDLCEKHKSFCTTLTSEVSKHHYAKMLQSHAFTLCVEGGGLDPAPKAFDALYNGSIPIILRTTLAPAYHHLPVIFVDSWNSLSLTQDKLQFWADQITSTYHSFDLSHRLTLDHWWGFISQAEKI